MSSLQVGGGERNVVAVLPHLRAAGVDVTLATLTSSRDSFLADDLAAAGIPRVELDAHGLFDLRAAGRLRAWARTHDVELVHTQDQYTNILGALAFGVTPLPLVMTRHVMHEDAAGWKEAVKSRLTPLAAWASADRVIAVSDAVRARFGAQAHLSAARCVTVHNGIDTDVFTPGPRDVARRALGWDPTRPTVLMVAVARPGKGHEVLLAALPALRRAVPDVAVMVAGGGPLLDGFVADAAAAGFGDVVTFLGDRSDVVTLVQASDVLVLPSWSEALPTVLLEAGAIARPCVTTAVGGAPEIVVDGATGRVVPAGDADALADALGSVLADADVARAMGEAARARVVAEFSLPAQAAGTVGVYGELLARRGRRR